MSIFGRLTDKQKHDQWMKGMEEEADRTMLRGTAFFIATAWIALAIWVTGGTLEMAGYANIGTFGGLFVHWAGCRKKQKGPRHPEG